MKIVDDTLIGRDARQAELFCSKTLLFERNLSEQSCWK